MIVVGMLDWGVLDWSPYIPVMVKSVNTSTIMKHHNRFPGIAEANSPQQGNLIEYVASGKRTKRRTLNSAANEHSLQLVEASSIPVDVGGYRVKAANAPILISILAKYGDIAAHCMFTSAAVRASMLKVICDIVKRLQSSNAVHIISHLEAMETEVHDAEAAKIEVSWLQQCLQRFREAEVGRSPSELKQMNASIRLVSKAAERDLAAAQKWAKEAESCLRALAVVGRKVSEDIEAKGSEWRSPLDELAQP